MICVDLAGVLQAAGALRKARDGDVFVLLDPGFTVALLGVLPADEITFNDLDVRVHHCTVVKLLPIGAEEPDDVVWRHFWDTLSCSYAERVGRLRGGATVGGLRGDRHWHCTLAQADGLVPGGKTLVMPLPAPPGIARRLVFSRGCGPRFSGAERDAAVLLQPHIADALRVQGRRAASRLLTGRQRELLRLVAAGHDNTEIASQLGVSPATVRKHLENAFARLEVSIRTAAVARICPNAAWR